MQPTLLSQLQSDLAKLAASTTRVLELDRLLELGLRGLVALAILVVGYLISPTGCVG